MGKGRLSLYLDIYPPVANPDNGIPVRKHYLKIYIYEKPKTELERLHNKETIELAETVRSRRQLDLGLGQRRIPPPESDEIMTIVLPLGKHNDLICNGSSSFMGRVDENENRSKIVISARSHKEGEWLFEGLCSGGNVEGHSAKVRGEPRQACSATGTGFSGLPCLTV